MDSLLRSLRLQVLSRLPGQATGNARTVRAASLVAIVALGWGSFASSAPAQASDANVRRERPAVVDAEPSAAPPAAVVDAEPRNGRTADGRTEAEGIGGTAPAPALAPAFTLAPADVGPGFLVPVGVGKGMAEQVRDMRGTVAALVAVYKERAGKLGLEGWPRQAAEFDRLSSRLYRAPISYGNAVNITPRAWNFDVSDSLGDMAAVLGSLHGFTERHADALGRMGNGIVDQVDDVRETLDDLVGAVRKEGPKFGFRDWEARGRVVEEMGPRLEEIQKRLMDPLDPLDQAEARDVSRSLQELASMTGGLRRVLMVRI